MSAEEVLIETEGDAREYTADNPDEVVWIEGFHPVFGKMGDIYFGHVDGEFTVVRTVSDTVLQIFGDDMDADDVRRQPHTITPKGDDSPLFEPEIVERSQTPFDEGVEGGHYDE